MRINDPPPKIRVRYPDPCVYIVRSDPIPLMKELRKLNFNKLISVGVPDVTTYSYDEYKDNGYKHKPINGYCVSCEKKGCNHAKNGDTYKLSNISHGAHSSDFFRALKEQPDRTGWHNEPIMFVFETPSRGDYNINEEVSYDGYKKHPSKDWYWIHEDQEHITYPVAFKGGEYKFVWSVTLTFKLANVYVTNLVKCGLNDTEGNYEGIESFQDETVKNCYSNFLKEEISILKPKIIFAVGANAEWWVNELVKEHYCFVQYLPHPARGQGGFRNAHFKTIYFWDVVSALHNAKIINTDEGRELAKLYLDKFYL